MKTSTIILIAWIAILLLICLGGCSTTSIKEVNRACRDGNIAEFKERNSDKELTFECYEREAF